MLIVMLIFLLALLFIVWESKKDLMSPSFLLIAGYIITTVCSIYNVERWQSKISGYMLFIVAIGIISFLIGEELAGKIISLKNVTVNNDRNQDLTYFVWKTSTFRCILLAVICILSTIIVYQEVVRIAYIDFKEWGNLIYNYKENMSEVSMKSLGRIGMRLTKSIAFIAAFLLMNNLTEAKQNRRNIFALIIYIIPIVTYTVQSLMTGSRIAVIMLVLGMVFSNITLKYIKSGKKININIKRIVQVVIALVVVCILFFNIQEMVGRQQKSQGVIDYISTYLGGSYDLFSQYIRENPYGTQVVETFSGIVDNCQRYFDLLTNVKFSIYPEFRWSQTGILIGNTYTGFRNYYNDLGMLGVILFSLFLGLLFSLVYRYLLVIRRYSTFRISFFIIYSSYIYCILFHFFADYFYLKISVGMFIEIILMLLCIKFILGRKCKLGRFLF